MSAMKTPGVYTVERNAFPTAVVEVSTAIPAFVGYTEKAMNGSTSLKNKPWRITSMAEYHSFFGGAPQEVFGVREPEYGEYVNSDYIVGEYIEYERKYTFYYNMLFFFANGGGACYIVSVGNYQNALDANDLKNGISTLLKEPEPTMLVVPEAVNLEAADCMRVQLAMLSHCGNEMRNRIALLDVFEGYRGLRELIEVGKNEDETPIMKSVIANFRDSIGSNFLDYGAAYYSWANTAILQNSAITLLNIKQNTTARENCARTLLAKILTDYIKARYPEVIDDPEPPKDESDEIKRLRADRDRYLEIIKKIPLVEGEKALELDKTLKGIIALYKEILNEALHKANCLPVSAAMAGIFTTVDNTRGVWKAPANVSMASVVSPTVNLTHTEQEDLNMPLDGKAINAIRYFAGEGNKVWGARTLDGNSLDYRFINVRRMMMMMEESIKNATRAYVFEPNVGNTWVSVKSMINNFLHGIWKQGGLAGATPEEAYSVHVGLGDTMTSEDVLNGVMKITVLVAMVRPAEFIEITFQQQMQKS